MQDPGSPGSRDPGILGSQDPWIPGGKLTQEQLFGSVRIDPSFGAMVLRGSGPQVSRTPISRCPENTVSLRNRCQNWVYGKSSGRIDPYRSKVPENSSNKPQNTYMFFSWILGFALIVYSIYKFYEAKKRGKKMTNETKKRNKRIIFRFAQGALVGSIVTIIIFYNLTHKEHERMHQLLEKHGIEEHSH